MNYIMFIFMAIAIADILIFDCRYEYGNQLKKGIAATGELILCMAGLMCCAPLLAKVLFKIFSPIFRILHIDTAMIGGMFFATDMGGLSIVKQMTNDSDIHLLSGVFLSSTLGCILIFIIPVLFKMCREDQKEEVSKGILCGITASFICPVISGLCMGIPIFKILKCLIPVFIFIAFIVVCMLKYLNGLLKVLLKFAKIVEGISLIFLFFASLDTILGIRVIKGMDALNTKLVLIAQIGIVLMGAYPMVYFISKKFGKGIHWIAKQLHISDTSVSAMIASLANPIPAFEMIGSMESKGVVVSTAFICGATACLGDYVGFLTSLYPSAIGSMIIGKICTGLAALALTLKIAH